MKRYFIGMVVQEEKTGTETLSKQELLEHQLQQQMIADDHDSEEDENGELNETINKTSGLNETLTNIKNTNTAVAATDTDHENMLGSMHTGSEKETHSNHVQVSPALV